MILTVDDLKDHIGWTDDVGSADDALLERLIAAAQNHVERLLGFAIEATYGGDGQDPVPPALVEAVSQLASHWYENREAALVGVSGQDVPFGVWQIVNEYRNWSWADGE